MSARPTIRLSREETHLTLPAPSSPAIVETRLGQAQGRTAGGACFVYDLGSTRHLATLELRSLTLAERDGLVAFFRDTTNGMAAQWTLRDAAGRDFTARFAEPSLAFTQIARNVFDVTLRLETTEPLD